MESLLHTLHGQGLLQIVRELQVHYLDSKSSWDQACCPLLQRGPLFRESVILRDCMAFQVSKPSSNSRTKHYFANPQIAKRD